MASCLFKATKQK